MVKFKFRINRSIERDSRVYFGQAEIDALHFRAFRLRRSGMSKTMADDAVRMVGFNSTAIRSPGYEDFVVYLIARGSCV
jgi:hypothetical protein